MQLLPAFNFSVKKYPPLLTNNTSREFHYRSQYFHRALRRCKIKLDNENPNHYHIYYFITQLLKYNYKSSFIIP